jgi:alkanesulfonate monooxygenase SsuD/methylene tetrahydromethanopterin reductase-like flavin-dependent oxidoreductase (luciferase family)
VLVRSAATADEISGGRVTLGMGAGWQEREHEAYGFAFPSTRERIARFGEQLEIAHRLLHDERVGFEGTYYRLDDAPGLQRPGLTLLVGGSAKPGTALPAAKFADEYNVLFGSLDDARTRIQALDEACEQQGRDPSSLRRSLMTPLVVGRDDRELHESARRVGSRFGRDPQEVLDRYAQNGPVGTVEQVVERLRQIAELGYDRVMLQHLAHRDLDTVALIGRELVPAVA